MRCFIRLATALLLLVQHLGAAQEARGGNLRWRSTAVAPNPQRRLTSSTSLPSCAGLRNTSVSWKITCNETSCSNPLCPVGFFADADGQSCSLAPENAPSTVYWEAPECVPWTVELRMFGSSSASVENLYQLSVQAIGADGFLSSEESRTVMLVLQRPDGFQSLWPVSLASGVGSVEINQTKATEAQLQLIAGSDFNEDVLFPELNVTFLPGATSSFSFAESSTVQGTVDSPVPIEVRAFDRYGNLATSEAGVLVTLAWQLVNDASVGGNRPTTFQAGIGIASLTSSMPGTYRLSLQNPVKVGVDVSAELNMVLLPGAPVRFAFEETATGAGGQIEAGAQAEVRIIVQDQHGNRVTDVSEEVIAIAASADGGIVANSSVNISVGEGSWRFTHTIAEVLTLSLSRAPDSLLDVDDVAALQVVPAIARLIRISASAGAISPVDAPINVELEAHDHYGNRATASTAHVSITSSEVDELKCTFTPIVVQLVAGMGTSSISCQELGTMNVSLQDSHAIGLAMGMPLEVTFIAGSAVAVEFTVRSFTGVVGSWVTVTLQSVDLFGHAAPATGSLALTTNGSATTASMSSSGIVVLDASGAGALNWTSTVAEVLALSIMDTYSVGLDVSDEASMVFTASSGIRFAFEGPPVVAAEVTSSLQLSVAALDVYGNIADKEQSDVTVMASSAAAGTWSLGLVDISDGRGHITVSYTSAGNITLGLSDSEGTGLEVSSTVQVMFQAGLAVAVVVVADVSTGSVDEPLRVDLRAVDIFGNLASLDNKRIQVLASGTGQVDPPTVELEDGVGEASVSATAVGEVVVSLLDSGTTGLDVTSTLALTFTPGVPAQFGFLAPATAVVGEEANVTLVTLDQYGNRAFASPGAAVTTTLMASGSGEVVPGGTASWNQAQGAASFGLRNTVAEEVALSVVVDPANALDASAMWRLQFLPGAMQTFEFHGCPVFVLAGNAADVALTAIDRFGNTAEGFSGQVQLAASDASTPLSLSVVSGQGELELSRADPSVVLLSVVGHVDVACNVSFVIDISPPMWDTLTVRAQGTQAVVSVTGLSEPSTLWCVRVDPAHGPPQVPPNNSNEAVFPALIGADPPIPLSSSNNSISENSSSGASTSYASIGTAVVTSSSTWALLQLQNLEPGTMYEVRCILADVVGNFAPNVEVSDIVAVEATSTTAATTTLSSGNSGVASTSSSSSSQPTGSDGGGRNEEEGVMWLLIILAISIACICGIPLSAAALWMCRKELNSFSERSSQKLQEGGFRWQEEENEASFFHTRCNRFEDSELWDLRGSGRERYKDLLQEAYKMRQELMDDLQRHMAPLPRSTAQPDDGPGIEVVETTSDIPIASPDVALVKDVHSFLQKPLYVDPDPMQVYVSRLPELRISLTEDEQERIEAVMNLARAMWDGNWEECLASFDKAWKEVEGELWQATRSQVRADQVRYHQAKLDASTALQQLEASVGQQWDQSELHLLEGLEEEEQKFNEETDVHLKALKGLAARWPKEAADRRGKLVEELTSPIAEPETMEDGEHQQRQKPPPQPPRSIRSAIAKLRELRWSQEDKLDAEIRRLEKFGNGRVEVVRKEQVTHWEEQCKKLDASAAELRGEIAGKKRAVASLCHQAEQAAAHAIVGVWRGLRHTAVERDVQRELSDLEEQIQVHRRRVINATESNTQEATQERKRGLSALDRTAALARQWVADEKQRRLAHWSRAAELRGREHLRAAQRRHVEAERRLKDDMVRVEEVAADAQAKRRYGLTIGSGHQAEVAKLTISAAARHGRIILGLEAAAASNAAEEHVRRQAQHPGVSGALPYEDWSTSARWKAGSFADELSAIAAKVAEALSKHNYQQRSLLLQTQRRQAILARMPEGDDQQREDILDALEECMNREIRAVRVAFQAGSAVAAVTRGDGEATELGRSLASVHRHTEVLVSEAEIGNRYDRLRALVLAGGEMSEEEAAACAAVQLEVQELEKQALELRALALDGAEDDNEGEDAEEIERQSTSKAKQRQQESSVQRMASQVEYLNAACEQEAAKQTQLEASLQARREKMEADVVRARKLLAEGQMENAMQLLAAAVQGDEASDASLDREMSELLEEVHHGSEVIEVAATEAKETLRRTRSARQKRRESAELKAKELLEVGLPDEAMIVAISLAQDIEAEEAKEEAQEEAAAEKALDTETSEAERAKLFASFMDHKAKVDEITAAEIERHRQRSRERREERRKKLQAALQLAEASDSEQEGVQSFFEAVRALERAARESLQPSKERFQARRAARQRRRETAERQSKELQAAGCVEDAVKQLEEAANELLEFFGEDSIAAADQGSQKQRELAEEQARLKADLATRRARLAEELERDVAVKQSKLVKRRSQRDKRRNDAEEEARALEARAAELRTTANLMLIGSGTECGTAVDAVEEWQEEARRRAAAGSAWGEGSSRKQQTVRARNAQMASARERIKSRQQSRKVREEATSLKPLGHAAQRVHKVVEQQLRPVMHMKRLMRHRRGPLLQRHRRDMELLRAEYEAKLRALEKRLHKDTQEELLRGAEHNGPNPSSTDQMHAMLRGGGASGTGSHAELGIEHRQHSGAKGRVHAPGEQARTAAMSMKKVNVKSITKQLSRVSNLISTSLDDSEHQGGGRTYGRSRRRPTTSDDVEEIALDSVGPLASTANEPHGLPLERQDSEESIPTTFLDHSVSKGNPATAGSSSPRKAWGN